MEVKRRIGYFAGGFSIGIVFLFVFLGGKRASCNYLPNDRVLADFARKKIELAPDLRAQLAAGTLDTIAIQKIVGYGDVNFSESDTDAKPCPLYKVYGKQELATTHLIIKNCMDRMEVQQIVRGD